MSSRLRGKMKGAFVVAWLLFVWPSSPLGNLFSVGAAEASREFNTQKLAPLEVQQSLSLSFQQTYLHQTPKQWGQACIGEDQYFTQQGGLGAKGKILKRELSADEGARSTHMRHLFFRNNFPGMERLCPNFGRFNDDERLNFWIWYFSALAETESECGQNAYNPWDPHGVSVGELQMPASWSNRYWRGVRFAGQARHAGGCEAHSGLTSPSSYHFTKPPAFLMADVDNNLTCGVEVLAGVLCGFYSSHGQCTETTQAPFGHGFWRKLQGEPSRGLLAKIRAFPLCR